MIRIAALLLLNDLSVRTGPGHESIASWMSRTVGWGFGTSRQGAVISLRNCIKEQKTKETIFLVPVDRVEYQDTKIQVTLLNSRHGGGGHSNDKRGIRLVRRLTKKFPKHVFPGLEFTSLNKYIGVGFVT